MPQQRLQVRGEIAHAESRTAVEELIRWDAPLQLFERTVVADTAVGEVTVEQRQKIAALLGAASPEDLDAIERKMRELAAQDLPYDRQLWPRLPRTVEALLLQGRAFACRRGL